LNFVSDNVTGAAPEILAAIEVANADALMPYGYDELTRGVEDRIREVFETDADVFLVATGSAANSLALAVLTPPYGAVICHCESHINKDECGAPEFFTSGAKLIVLNGDGAKIDAADLDRVAADGRGNVHSVQPATVSITQETEAGTVYSLGELAAISQVCRHHDMKLHVDGARFANALVALGCSPAEATWKAGVDILSFGATKNGALAAEAVVLFEKGLAEEFAFRRKRGGHLFSKMRLLAAQWDAYLTDDLWLRNATHANAMAQQMAAGLAAIPGVTLSHPVVANELFPNLPEMVVNGLKRDGFRFYEGGGGTIRLVCAFNTRAADVDAFIAAAERHARMGDAE